MCVVSMIMDHYTDGWGQRLPYGPYEVSYNPTPLPDPEQQKKDIDRLKEMLDKGKVQPVPAKPKITDEEIREFRRLLERAREYDARNHEPDCELQSKKELLKELTRQLGVEIKFL